MRHRCGRRALIQGLPSPCGMRAATRLLRRRAGNERWRAHRAGWLAAARRRGARRAAGTGIILHYSRWAQHRPDAQCLKLSSSIAPASHGSGAGTPQWPAAQPRSPLLRLQPIGERGGQPCALQQPGGARPSRGKSPGGPPWPASRHRPGPSLARPLLPFPLARLAASAGRSVPQPRRASQPCKPACQVLPPSRPGPGAELPGGRPDGPSAGGRAHRHGQPARGARAGGDSWPGRRARARHHPWACAAPGPAPPAQQLQPAQKPQLQPSAAAPAAPRWGCRARCLPPSCLNLPRLPRSFRAPTAARLPSRRRRPAAHVRLGSCGASPCLPRLSAAPCVC